MADEGENAVVGTAQEMPQKTGCRIEGCAGKHLARGLCRKHYSRLRRTGDPESEPALAIGGQKSAVVRAGRAARKRAEEAGIEVPASYRRKKADVFTRQFVKVIGDGMWQDAATPHLYLSVKNGGAARSYIFRYRNKAGKNRQLGLGSAKTVDLERARQDARDLNDALGRGEDPEQVRKASPASSPLVNDLCDEYLRKFYGPHIKLSDGQKNQMGRLFENYIRPAIGAMRVKDVTRGTIWTTVWDQTDRTRKPKQQEDEGARKPKLTEGTLEYLWVYKHQTGALLRMHLIRMFGLAEDVDYIDENTITSAWFKRMLVKREQVHTVEHHRSVAYKDVYRFLEAVRAARTDPSPRALKFWGGPARQLLWLVPIKSLVIEMQMYSGVRHKELRHARWGEIDWERLRWDHPAKPKRGLRRPIPISPQMLRVLDEARRRAKDCSPEALIFPGPKDRPIGASQMKLFMMKQVKWPEEVDPHGARSTLQDWRRAETEYDEALWKIQVGQHIGDKTAQAYGPDLLLARRRRMMNDWGKFCDSPDPILRDPEEEEDKTLVSKSEKENVVSLADRKRKI